jgi:hypothetical protein
MATQPARACGRSRPGRAGRGRTRRVAQVHLGVLGVATRHGGIRPCRAMICRHTCARMSVTEELADSPAWFADLFSFLVAREQMAVGGWGQKEGRA